MQKNKHPIILLLTSIITSGIAQGITVISIPWYFTESLNQSSNFSLWYGILTMISFFWGLYAGVIIDQFNRKKILLSINLISACIFGIIGLTNTLFEVQNSFVLFFTFSISCFYYMIFFPNLYALAQELVDKKEYVKINSIIEIQSQTISIIAALMCGILLSGSQKFFEYFELEIFIFEKWSISEVFILNGILYIISYLILLPMDYDKSNRLKIPRFTESLFDIQKALSFIIKKKEILIYGICSQIIFAFLIVELFTLLPLFVKNCLNESLVIFSLADVTYCIGAVLAAIVTHKLLKLINKIDLTILLIIISAYAFLAMISFELLNVFFISSLIIGLTNASVRITRMSYFFQKIPNYLIGRINTIFNSINTIIRNILIFVFSHSWFTYDDHVKIAYTAGIAVLICFVMPLLIIQLQKLTK